MVDSNIALNCDNFCECVGYSESTCYFGPDDKGVFIEEIGVSSEMADSCNWEWCICNTHDFGNGETFESVFAQKQAAAVDVTVPNAEPAPVTGSLIKSDKPPIIIEISGDDIVEDVVAEGGE